MRWRWHSGIGASKTDVHDGAAALLHSRRATQRNKVGPRQGRIAGFGFGEELKARMAPAGVGPALQLIGQVDPGVRAAGIGALVVGAGVMERQPQVCRRVFDRHQLDEEFTRVCFEALLRHNLSPY